MTAADKSVVIVGAGPAGLAAARSLIAAGVRPVVLDESAAPGGQGFRRLSPQMAPDRTRLFKAEVPAMIRRETAEDAVLAACDYRPGTLVWGHQDASLELLGPNGYESLAYRQLLLSVGATDRLLPLPGWTLPGVFTLGGAQVSLKRHASFIGHRVVFAGSSPLLYLAAAQYLRLGLKAVAVLDTTPLRAKLRALPAMLRHDVRTTLYGLRLMAELRHAGVAVRSGVRLRRVLGGERVEGIVLCDANNNVSTIGCDAVALGYGLRPETQLAELAGADFAFDALHRHWFPKTDDSGRAGERLWVVGDGARTGGAKAAGLAGELAALSMLAASGRAAADPGHADRLQAGLVRQRAFQDAMAGAFRWPREALLALPEDTVVCRCERVALDSICKAIKAPLGPVEVNRVKAVTRCGMGRCQGRFCGPALSELTALVTGLPDTAVGRLRAQAPVRPIPLVP